MTEQEHDDTLLEEEMNREVCRLLMTVVGETNENEGAVKVVKRLIAQSRDTVDKIRMDQGKGKSIQ